jgi:hypothetical protein
MLGSWSAIEGASAELRGGRIMLVDREGSNMVPMIVEVRMRGFIWCNVDVNVDYWRFEGETVEESLGAKVCCGPRC